ncbi:LysR substrate-binding domain-containing protein [Pseudomonas guariconensis]|uniref:LysR substrate-binding domain-containing protein n=1 Tax=Pseudomonas TaxID=286 RepID=UPI001CE3B85F|nr:MULTISPECIES: LysR substrate-binding domain-containing protein [Pseudomonas]MCO7636368.1 LysR substrate-binding domain-containing protein [Pseudomonas sp. S 311-6]MCO7516048.1 LysR substrate-binding domain-containing protein [Pseudomonas putida]MCO7563789.1 LysR substrate-binding domain-containing protein [Pseudomonas mosselii]MCO7594142.1 LysR substrate-binding domain-containing protein [Pseudomonas guariconensis]MCO7606754.1 LysR substrate-binding domain-containing protein [Pseudomonas gu
MSQLPPLRALEVFEAVGLCGGITQAAKRLGISAGAVSQQMKILEQAVGLSLTVKEGQRLRLNAAGQRFHEGCSQAFERLRAAYAGLERSKNTSNLYISALPSLLSKWLAPLVAEWQAAFPQLSIYLDGTHTEPSEAHANGVDFRLSYGAGMHDDQHTLELFRDCVVPACSPALLDAKVDADRLLALPLITIDWRPKFDSPPSWEEWFATAGIGEVQIANYRIYSLSSMAIQAAIDGQGIVLAQYSMISRDVDSGKLMLPCLRALPMPASYYLTWNPGSIHHGHCRAFQRWLIERGRDQQEVTQRLLAESPA